MAGQSWCGIGVTAVYHGDSHQPLSPKALLFKPALFLVMETCTNVQNCGGKQNRLRHFLVWGLMWHTWLHWEKVASTSVDTSDHWPCKSQDQSSFKKNATVQRSLPQLMIKKKLLLNVGKSFFVKLSSANSVQLASCSNLCLFWRGKACLIGEKRMFLFQQIKDV